MRREKMSAVLLLSVFCFTLYSRELTIVGTGSGASILKEIGKAFTKQNPNIKVIIPESTGSGGGIKAVGNDKNIAGRIARSLNEREKGYGLTVINIAKMPIVFMVHPSVTLKTISESQICDIYSGKIRKWDEFNGGTGKIRVIRREDGDSSLKVLLKSLSQFSKIEITPRSRTTFSDPLTITTCSQTPNSIAFGTWPNIINNKNVVPLKLNNISPTDSEYPCFGTLALIYKEENLEGDLKKFINFLSTKAASDAIKKAGGIPAK